MILSHHMISYSGVSLVYDHQLAIIIVIIYSGGCMFPETFLKHNQLNQRKHSKKQKTYHFNNEYVHFHKCMQINLIKFENHSTLI